MVSMKNSYSHGLGYDAGLLSAFDISGSLLMPTISRESRSTDRDTQQLLKDLKRLEEDYKKAYEKITNDFNNEQKNS